MRKRILILLVLVGLGFGVYSLGKFIIDLSQRPQNINSPQEQEQKSPTTAQARDFADNVFEVNEYTPDTYRPPNFDPFSNKYRPTPDYKEILGEADIADTLPTANFLITSAIKGFGDQDKGTLLSGTVNTEFIFYASSLQDKETPYDRLQVRWDFDGDRLPDTFFSRTKRVRHTYEKIGTYTVTMEVLDGGRNVAAFSRTFKVVTNTEPSPFFAFTPTTGTPGTVFTFNTQKSPDSQYLRPYLMYRFDWNSDGQWDTEYERKTMWRHIFKDIGTNLVTMETRDPEGMVEQATATIVINENSPPVANFTIARQTLNSNQIRYTFDASSSNDRETPLKKLLFRWDYNYTGENDIVFDTHFSTSHKNSGSYTISGQKTIRLQVKDEDGAAAEAFQTFEAQGTF